ncbi:cell division protein FtsI [Corynebacterium phocae]|uniref:Cell division protein FtsI n=1 Tax=Corynebacterium phocae TaxID=161895 RepID=A0A1L7D2K0_9CORY|nr:penicillin-binding transpeptidase domain-containing protein [Corynebacterium phocae]APT92325.1 cell division protein FtsI [Corynebacterium phocae]KAA8724915.1 penicillin-binding transpeptidase domain-containing protein [Corynebacterium phocae]
MKKTVALLCVMSFAGSLAQACTPKPLSAEPVIEDFVTAFETRDTGLMAAVVDKPDQATEVYTTTFDGLQAEGVDVEVKDIKQNESTATATYTVTWDLPRDRTVTYDSSIALTKTDERWTVRWQPTSVHPRLGLNQHLELRAVTADRASVVSSDGVELLSPGLQYRLLVDTNQIDDPRAAARIIATSVGGSVDAAQLGDALEKHEGIYSVGVYEQPPTVNLPGVRINEEPALINVRKDFAPDVMARVSKVVSDRIDGTNGWRIAIVNPHGASLTDIEFHEAQPAPAIRVSIDSKVQQAAEEAVRLRADSEAMMVVMRPSTGQILAVAQTDAANRKGDLALSGLYPPGSVFKILTAAAGLQHEGLSSNSIVPCPGSMNIYGRTVVNYNGFSLGSVPLERAFAQSCNTTFADISTRLNTGQLKEEAKRFGMGLDYDIPGLNTATGSVPAGETPLERTEAGYGQGLDLVSPFGMALVSATVAAGHRPVPTLISNQETTPSANPDGPTPYVIDNLRTMMRQTVTSGTAAGMQAGGAIYGKTGEAEINQGSHAWFTGFRDDDLAFATLVVLGGGSTTSVNITDHFLRTLDALRAGG